MGTINVAFCCKMNDRVWDIAQTQLLAPQDADISLDKMMTLGLANAVDYLNGRHGQFIIVHNLYIWILR